MGHNLQTYEIIGLILIFLGGTTLGIGLYVVLWGANRPLFYGSLDQLIRGREFLLFPLFFGLGALLWVLGKIELREAMPGKKRRW